MICISVNMHLSIFKVPRDRKSPIFTRIECFRIVTPVWIYQWLWHVAQSVMWYGKGSLLFFKVIHQISRSRGTKNYHFFTRNERFRTVTPVWINRWIGNDVQSLMLYRRGTLSFFKVVHQISRYNAGWLMDDLNPIWVRLLDWWQLSSPSDLPCYNLNYCFYESSEKNICIEWFGRMNFQESSNILELPRFMLIYFHFIIWLSSKFLNYLICIVSR